MRPPGNGRETEPLFPGLLVEAALTEGVKYARTAGALTTDPDGRLALP